MPVTLPEYTRRITKLASIVCLLCLYQGCVKETYESCRQESLLLLKIVDAVTGTDITDSENVDMVDLFIFDSDGYLMEHIVVSSDSIRQRIPVSVKSRGVKGLIVSAWGNLNDEQMVSEVTKGYNITQLSVMMKTTEEGYAACPGNLFFGMEQIHYEPNKIVLHHAEIPVSQKNARMFITVRGLPVGAVASDYYFTICGVHQGYDFRGIPLDNSLDIKQTGVFRANNYDFVTPEVFNLVHALSANKCLTINLHQANLTKATESIIVSATEDSDGNPIAPSAGETSNVLIDLRPEGPVNVIVKITPWDEIYLWENW